MTRVRFAVWVATIVSLTGALILNVQAETLRIGLIAPLTGPGAPWGLAAQGGANIAASEINAKGGLDVGGTKYDVELVVYDDKLKAAEGVSAFHRLVDRDGVKYIFVLSSPSTLAVKDDAESEGIVTLTSGSTLKAFSADTKYMFRLYSPPTDFVPSLVHWLRDNLTQRRIVLINPNNETGWIMSETSQKAFKQDGFEVLEAPLFEVGVTDFAPLLTRVLGMNPEIIDIGAAPPATSGLLVRQARELGFKGVFVKTSGGSPMDIVAGAGKEASEGTVDMLFAAPANPGFLRLADAYKKQYGHEPNDVIASYYDGVNVLLRAIAAAGSVSDTAKVASSFNIALPMTSVQGEQLTLGGKDRIGVDHQVMSVNYIGIIKDGVPVVVGKVSP